MVPLNAPIPSTNSVITEMTKSQAERISVTGLPSLMSELAEKLDGVLDSRVFGGNYDVCRRIAGEVHVGSRAESVLHEYNHRLLPL